MNLYGDLSEPKTLVVFMTLLDSAIKGFVILGAAGVWAALMPKASAATRHLVWALALSSLIVLTVFSLTLPKWQIPILPRSHAPAPAGRQEEKQEFSALPTPSGAPGSLQNYDSRPLHISPAAAPHYQGSPVIWADKRTDRPNPEGGLAAIPPREASRAVEPKNISHGSVWLLAVWSVGFMVVMGHLIVGFWKLWRIARRSSALTDVLWTRLLDEVSSQCALRRRVLLIHGGQPNVPATWGVLRPIVFLPDEALDWSPERRRIVLLHELAHIKRQDYLLQVVAKTACALHWFNPLVWLAARRLRIEREQACDDCVLRAGEKASAYAGHLLDIARSGESVSNGALAMTQTSQIEGRLRAILDVNRSRGVVTRRTLTVASLVVACLALPFSIMRPTARAQENSEKPETERPTVQLAQDLKEPAGEASERAKKIFLEALRAESVPEAGGPASPSEISGYVTDEYGNPRPNVFFAHTMPDGLFRGPRSDRDGRFTLKKVQPGRRHWLAYSQSTQKIALFSVTEDSPREWNVPLNLDSAELSGRVVDPNGEGVANARVDLRIETPRGDSFIWEKIYCDPHGFYEIVPFPTGDGLTVQGRVVASDDAAPPRWSERLPLRDRRIFIEMSDLHVDTALAAASRKNQLPARMKGPYFNKEARVRYGGTVLNEDQDAIEGVKVSLMYSTGSVSSHLDHAETDAKGRWGRFLPENLTDISVRVEHRDYIPSFAARERKDPPLARVRDGSSVMTMTRGFEIDGTVRNEDGAPIGDALVLLSNLYTGTTPYGEPIETLYTPRSDRDGRFRLSGMPFEATEIVVSARGYAPASLEIDAQGVNSPLEVILNRGGTIWGRVVDSEGNAVEGAEATCRQWTVRRGHNLTRIAESDSEGRFEINHLPLIGDLEFFFGKTTFFHTSASGLKPREEPYQITLYKKPDLKGAVVDDSTGEPVRNFDVAAGFSHGGTDPSRLEYRYSHQKEVRDSADGSFTIRVGGAILTERPSIRFAARISAEGYLPAFTPFVAPGEKVDPFVVRLRRGRSWTGTVVAPDGEPARGAEIAWIEPGRKAFVKNGRQHPETFRAAAEWEEKTDERGRFELPPRDGDGMLFVLHETGYFYRHSSLLDRDSHITLIAWARIEGVVRSAGQPVASEKLQLRPVDPELSSADSPVLWFFDETSHVDGTFAFEYVPSIALTVGRLVVTAGNLDLSHGITFTPLPGANHLVNFGGGGASVVGRLELEARNPATLRALRGVFDPKTIRARAISISSAEEHNATPGEIASDGPVFMANIAKDGSFRIDDLEPGDYQFLVDFHAAQLWNTCGANILLASAKTSFSVPATPKIEPMTIPVVTLTAVERVERGDQAPQIQAPSLSGEPFSLSRLRGKYVLLDFWATWCGPCLEQTPRIKALSENYADNDRFEIVGLNLDPTRDRATRYIERNELNWTQVALGTWGKDNLITQAFGVGAIPSFWLIDPRGRVIARDIPPEQLESAVENVLNKP